MQEPLVLKDDIPAKPGPALQKPLIVSFYQCHQYYKQLSIKFHKLVLYIFCVAQLLWLLLSFNIKTVNNYNYFIVQFESNFNEQYKTIYLKNHPKYANILQHVNSFDNDYTIICWLIWMSHFGFEIIFAYILYANRMFFKEYATGVKQILPIFFTLLTTFVIRDCLLMSVSQVVSFDLSQIRQLLQSQHDQFLTYDTNFRTFISNSLLFISNLTYDFKILLILTYIQQFFDAAIIISLTILIFRIYWTSTKCAKFIQQIKEKNQFAIEPLVKPLPPQSHRHDKSELNSKISQERQYSLSFHHQSMFGHQRNFIQSHKEIGGYSHKEPIGYSQKEVGISKALFSVPQNQAGQLRQRKQTNKSHDLPHLRKLQRSGSCNYLKGSQDISEQIVVESSKKMKPSSNAVQHQDGLGNKIKVRKQVSLETDIQKKIIKRTQRKNSFFDKDNFVKGQHVVFQV